MARPRKYNDDGSLIVKEDKKADSKETKVSVEMTEKEKKAFTEFMAEKKADDKEKVVEEEFEGELRFAGWINGIQYGPGHFSAPKSIARALQAQDDKCFRQRLKEKDPDSYMIQIIERGVKKITKIQAGGM